MSSEGKPDLLKVLLFYGTEVNEHRQSQLVRCIGPNHLDTKASLSVSLARQLVNCMACDLRGDVYRIVEIMEGLPYGAAVQRSAEIAGVPAPVPTGGGRPGLSGEARSGRGGFKPKTRRGSLRPREG